MRRKPETHETLLRQWEMLRMIPRHPGKVSATEISSRLQSLDYAVTKRTVERDLVTLSSIFPIVSDTRSMPFGWSWQQGAAPIDVPQLTATQALAFVLMEQHLGSLLPGSVTKALGSYTKMAHQRLADVAHGGAGRRWLERVRVIPPTQSLIPPKVSPNVHEVVTEGLLRDRKIAITYRSRGTETSRLATVNPLGLVQRGALTYVIVSFEGYQDARTLALHRISKAELLPGRAVQPEGFDFAQHIARGVLDFGSGASIQLVALFEAEATIHLAESPLSRDQVLESAVGGMVKVSATVTETPQLVWWLLGFGGRVEVLLPTKLRERMIETARTMGARYGLRSS